MTCRFWLPISLIINAIFSATLPLTPVSISSNMMVGSLTAPAMRALMASITRAISPPDATWLTGLSRPLLLALKRNCTWSQPLAVRVFSSATTSQQNCTLGMPRGNSLAFISFSIATAALLREADSFRARAVAVFRLSSTSWLSSFIWSSLPSMSESFFSSWCCSARS